MNVADVSQLQEQTSPQPTHEQDITFNQFDRYCTEIRDQPAFRQEMDKCCDYYDSNQLDQETLAELSQKGIGPLITNLVKPTVDVVLGMEAKTRSDWRVNGDDDASMPVAEALSQKLHESERETRADRACSDAYGAQIKAGLGWVEVSRNSDPFAYPYRVASVHRREMFWDWLRREPDIKDGRYLIRKRWFDTDAVTAFMPQHKALIEGVGAGWSRQWLERNSSAGTVYAQSLDVERGWNLEDYEWRDTVRGRICLFEVWYRVWCRGYVLKLPDQRVVELDMQNPVHIAAVGNGVLKPQPAVYSKLRKSIWVGPHKLTDRAYQSRTLPYVPFWGYQEDTTSVPYGLIRSMISPQDEINARRQKMLWLLSARRLTIDSDALSDKHNSIADVLHELNRPDAAIVLNPARQNKDAINIDSNLQLSAQQFKMMEEAKQSLQQAAGVYQAMLGANSNAQSGLAITSLVEQGTMTLAEINDNYRYSRQRVGELLVELNREDLIGQQVDVVVGENPKKKTISLNSPRKDPATQMQVMDNDVERARIKVALEDVPSTPAYRQQTMTMLGEVMKGMPPELQALIVPFWIESTELSKRKQIAQMLRQKLGVPDAEEAENQDPEVVALRGQVKALTQQLQEATTGPQMKMLEAKFEQLMSAAFASRAKGALDTAKAGSAVTEADLAVVERVLAMARTTVGSDGNAGAGGQPPTGQQTAVQAEGAMA